MEKICTRCKEHKALSSFSNNKRNKDGKASWCKKCAAEHNKEWQKKNPQKAKEIWRTAEKKSRNNVRRRASRFGLTVEQLNILLADNVCGICGREFGDTVRSHIDHDHDTGQVRGVLCTNCNTGIGNLRDDVELLRKAVVYLESASSLVS